MLNQPHNVFIDVVTSTLINTSIGDDAEWSMNYTTTIGGRVASPPGTLELITWVGGKVVMTLFVSFFLHAASPNSGEWSEWSECTRSCGGGTRFRVRMCGRADQCEAEQEECNKQDCNPEPFLRGVCVWCVCVCVCE